ncbi:unnamed protein product [Effrenium voratum]|nr:unnamed protein product [Effrenium voratum]
MHLVKLGSALLDIDLSAAQRRVVLEVRSSLQGDGPAEESESEGGAAAPEEAAAAAPFLLTGTSFLFTWNIGSPEDPHAEWLHFLHWRSEQAVGAFKSVRFSATMEESLRSDDVDRVHIHEQREVCKRLTRASLDPFVYSTLSGHAVRPNCATNYMEAVGNSSADGPSRGRGAAYRTACDRAYFYVQANKYGTLFTETNWPMQTNFRVQAKWFDDLVARGKLSRDQWLQYAFDATIGLNARKRNFDALEVYEKEQAMEVDSASLRQKIAATCPKKPWRSDLARQAQVWLQQFETANDRATILVLWGPSRSGKTRFAMSDVFGPKPLKVDVGDGQDLNIQAWDHRTHSHLVLDNVNSSEFIMRWRHVLMGPPEPVQLGQSSTGMYAYNVFLGRKPVICSMDEDATWETKKWLDANCEIVWVGDKCFVS